MFLATMLLARVNYAKRFGRVFDGYLSYSMCSDVAHFRNFLTQEEYSRRLSEDRRIQHLNLHEYKDWLLLANSAHC